MVLGDLLAFPHSQQLLLIAEPPRVRSPNSGGIRCKLGVQMGVLIVIMEMRI
jgi:hypothetical protein